VTGATVLAVLLMVVIVLGYVVLWAIWRLFFKGRGDEEPGGPSA
jgi:hypothetical protein